MPTTKKKPTAAQLEARRLFAERARSGAFKKNPKRKAAGAGMVKVLGHTVRKGTKRHAVLVQQQRQFSDLQKSETGKGRKNPKTPTPAQLRARAQFTKMAKARAAAARKANPLRFKSEKEFAAWKAKTGGAPRARKAPAKKRAGGIRSTAKAIGRNIVRGLGMAHNPRSNSSRGLKRSTRRHTAASKALYQSHRSGEVAKFRAASKQLARAKVRGRRKTKMDLAAVGRLASSRLPNPSKRQKRERRTTRAKRQQIVAFRQHGIRRPARRIGPGRLPNPRRTPGHVGYSYGKGRKAYKRAKGKGIKGYFSRGLDRSVMAGSRVATGRALSSRLPNPKKRASTRQSKLLHKRGFPKAHIGKAIKRRGSRSAMKAGGWMKNPAPAAVFSEFRGKDATTKTKARAATGTPSTLAKLGQLMELKLRGRRVRFGGNAALAADGRKKLHVVNVKAAVPNPPGEVDYGEILSVTYRADKPHIEEGVFDYVHKFGEEGGTRPHLVVDAEGYPKLEGGSYDITADGLID